MVRDFYGAMKNFMGDLLKDGELIEKTNRRFQRLFQIKGL
jgi:hypothetical protein